MMGSGIGGVSLVPCGILGMRALDRRGFGRAAGLVCVGVGVEGWGEGWGERGGVRPNGGPAAHGFLPVPSWDPSPGGRGGG